MFDTEIVLLTPDGFTTNKIGDEIAKFKEATVLGREKPITRSEYYFAGQAEISISKIIVVHPFEYAYQKLVRVDGVLYSVLKDYKKDNEEIELTLKVKAGNAND